MAPGEVTPLEITYWDVYNNFMPLMDLGYFACRLPSESDEEGDIKYKEIIRMQK
jgi:hypothetical protein